MELRLLRTKSAINLSRDMKPLMNMNKKRADSVFKWKRSSQKKYKFMSPKTRPLCVMRESVKRN